MQFSKPLTAFSTSDRLSLKDRLQIEYLVNANILAETEKVLSQDIINGLIQTPKSLPPRYFYDDRGSQLFEQICQLPEYYPTRTEASILQECSEEIARLTGPCEIVELGSGSSTKTRILLDAYDTLGLPLRYLPIDISGGILESSAKDLLVDYPNLYIHGLVSTYELALSALKPAALPTRMISFLGSSLGNLSPQECDIFFSQIRGALQPGEYFILGIDLHKSKQILEPAYNDSQGVTAAFNLNMLQHLNRKFEGNFNLRKFEHLAFYNEKLHQIEMHLKSQEQQTVNLRGLDLTVTLEAGETILTEISRKFEIETMQQYLKKQSLITMKTWTDSEQKFGLILSKFSPEI
ncbi:MAG: L-histidine N(alpha)-methyltransferase [Microcoleaceae cyanobacterium MO_207.B10]|nr:L-histidine N(alpha)-methyltransferase [Microcoleaceae cyanobacterium MO_207.B10]